MFIFEKICKKNGEMVQRFVKILLVFAFFWYFAPDALANQHYVFNNIGQREGLMKTIYSIYKSDRKDVWIGTDKGLYRYDGFNVRSYSERELDGNRIYHISTDSKGRLWVCSEAGVLRYNERTDSFQNIAIKGDKEKKGVTYTSFVIEDRLYFGGNSTILEFVEEEDALREAYVSNKPFSFMRMHLIQGGRIFCTGHDGVMLIDIYDGEEYELEGRLSSFTNIFASIVDDEQRIWLSEYNEGITVLDMEGRVLRKYSVENGLSCDVVLSLYQKDSKIWAGTDGGGINIIDMLTSSIEVLKHNPADKASLPANSIRSLYVDTNGGIWAGSVRDGLFSIKTSQMKTIQECYPGESFGLSNQTVLSLFQEKDSDYIWIGTDGGGINRLDQSDGRLKHYPMTYGLKVASIAEYGKDNLLLSIYSKGLYVFNKAKGVLTQLKMQSKELAYQMSGMGRTVHLLNESDGTILFLGNQIYRKNTASSALESLYVPGVHYDSDFFLPVTSESESSYAHDTYNIYGIIPGSAKAELIVSLSGAYINSAHCDDAGTIWIASSAGLARYDLIKKKLEFLPTTLFDSATTVIKDKKHRVWIGSENRLFAYLEQEGVFVLFGESDGVLDNEYIGKSALVAEQGHVYMGGVRGLLAIDRKYQVDRTEVPLIYLSSCMIDGERVFLEAERELSVPMKGKSVKVVVATNEQDIFRNKRYRYSIEGGTSYSYESDSPELILKPLPPPGRYTVSASCMTRGGTWTQQEELFSLIVPQIWYKTRWFVLLCLIVVALIILGVVVAILSHIENRNQLEIKEKERIAYENKVNSLLNWGNELKTPLTLVMAPLKRLIKELPETDSSYATISMAYRQAKRVKDYLKVVLDLREMEEGKSELDIQRYNFNEWVSATASDFITESAAQNIRITELMDSRIGDMNFDIKKCTKVLSQVLMKSLSLCAPSDVLLLSTSQTSNGCARVSLSGSGNYTPDIDISNMFNMMRGSNVGLGLSYAKVLVELHGGNAGAFINDMQGVTIWFEIPLSLEQERMKIEAGGYINEIMGESWDLNEAKDLRESEFDTSSSRLMLIDDSSDLLDFIKKALNPNFAEILIASDGADAMKMLEKTVPDIIVCDVNMPNGNGYEFCSEFRSIEKYNHIPVILLTTKQEQQSTQYGYKVGADGLLAKPFEVETLYGLIKNQLKRKSDIRKNREETEDIALYGYREETFIAKVNTTIAENISNPDLGVELLCKAIGISRSVLYNKLKTITGVGANDYIVRIRMEKAIFLIENTEMTFAEIADKIGLTPNYFSTTFRQFTGMTPTQYRKKRLTSNK